MVRLPVNGGIGEKEFKMGRDGVDGFHENNEVLGLGWGDEIEREESGTRVEVWRKRSECSEGDKRRRLV